MKPTLLYLLLCMALSGCVQSTVTRVRDDGAKEVIVTKGLSDRAASTGLLIGDRLLDRWLGADVEGGGK